MVETPGATPVADELVSRVLAGRYRIDRHLRRGGMGAVYVARDLKEDKDVAVKVVRQALLEDPQAISRFKREARLVTELSHENIVRSFDAGDDAGLLWIAMELLDGESMRERLDARGRLAWADTLPLVEQVAQALGAAHDQGIIHRDLKPENIMLVTSSSKDAKDGPTRAKLLDFGVAKQAHVEGQTSGTSNMTGTGLIVGTPGYVAPEVVLEGTTDDQRSDFYALGVVWFEMLTGQKPFTAKTAFALAMRHAHEPAPTPTSLVPYSPVPTPIERVVLRLLAKHPDDRPKDARELLITLATLAEESQKSLAGTPPPSLLSGNPHDATVTDLADIHRTGVVPFVGTPKPQSSMPGVRLEGVDGRPDKRPDMTGTGTPATAQFAPGMTPPGATPLPQLLGQIPKKVFAIAASAIVVVIVAGIGAGLVALKQLDGASASATSKPLVLPTPGELPKVPNVAPNVAPNVSPNVIIAPAIAPVIAGSAQHIIETDDVTSASNKRDQKREEREEKREERRRDKRERDTKDAKDAAPGKLFVKPLPVEGEWTIKIGDGYPKQSPLNMESAAPGTYRLTIESKKLGKTHNLVAEVKPGEATRLSPDYRAP